IRSFLEDWFGTYEELEFGPEEVRDLGNGVMFAVVVQNGRPAGSGGHLRQREGWAFIWVRGLIARLTISEVDEARAAAERPAGERHVATPPIRALTPTRDRARIRQRSGVDPRQALLYVAGALSALRRLVPAAAGSNDDQHNRGEHAAHVADPNRFGLVVQSENQSVV